MLSALLQDQLQAVAQVLVHEPERNSALASKFVRGCCIARLDLHGSGNNPVGSMCVSVWFCMHVPEASRQTCRD